MTTAEAERELHELMHGVTRWQYAFAMGHGCAIGHDEASAGIRRRDAELRAIIAESNTKGGVA